MRQADLLDLAAEFAEERLHRHLVAEVLHQVLDFSRAGYPTILATASPQELASAVAGTLGMTAAVGTVSEVQDGVYTGRLCGPVAHGPAKARRVSALLAEHGLDPRASWAFSDSVNDLPLLSLVRHPVAVNPDRDLAAIALTNGWRILRKWDADEGSPAALWAAHPFPFPY